MTDAERMVAALVEGDPEKAKRELARMLGEEPLGGESEPPTTERKWARSSLS